jgi:hypothetical protein
MQKTIYTLCVNNYSPEIRNLTFPFLTHYAQKIRAEIVVMDKEAFPGWPTTYQKFQILDLARERGDDWAIYVDGDAIIHPETPDYTELISKNTILHHGHDFSGTRWRPDDYFRRDGRHWSTCNWFTVASDWCRDIWQPLTDLTLSQALANIYPTPHELDCGITPAHLIDEYVMSRNIARYGIKADTVMELNNRIGLPNAPFFFHQYTFRTAEKVSMLRNIIDKIEGDWHVPGVYRSPGPFGGIPGQGMTMEELQWLYDRASEMSSVLEVGCWKGRSTHALLSGCKGPVYAVDHWLGSPTEREAAHAEAATKDVYAEFLTNVGHFKNLQVIRGSSVEMAARFDGKVDMVFIDGDHSVEGCLADIRAWLPKTRRLLCGHDRNQEGVPQALQESGLNWKPGPGSIWIHEIK